MAGFLETLLAQLGTTAEQLTRPPDSPTDLAAVLRYAMPGLGAVQAYRTVNPPLEAWKQTAAGTAFQPLLSGEAGQMTGGAPLGTQLGASAVLGLARLAHDIQQQGVGGGVETTRQRYEHTPQAFEGQKFLMEAPFDPINYVMPETGGIARGGATALREAAPQSNRVLKAIMEHSATGLEGVGKGADAYNAAANAVIQKPLEKGAELARKLPPLDWALTESSRALGNAFRQQGTDLAGATQRAASDLGVPITKGENLRTVMNLREPGAAAATDVAAGATGAATDAATATAGRLNASGRASLQAAGVDVAQHDPNLLRQYLDHAQQDLRVQDAIRRELELPDLAGQQAPRDLAETLAAAQARVPDADGNALLQRAVDGAATEAAAGTPVRTRYIPGRVPEPIRVPETVDDIKTALIRDRADPEEIRLAQAQFQANRYGDTFPATVDGRQHEANAVAARLQREQGAAPPQPAPPTPEPQPAPGAGTQPPPRTYEELFPEDVAPGTSAAPSPPATPAGPPPSTPPPVSPAPAGVGGRALTEAAGPSGQTYQFRYRVVDLNELVPSHTDAFTPNPRFAQALQPRDRERGLAQQQVTQMARDLRPEPLLMPSPELDRGPMIVGPDLLVESGNGRILAMRAAARENPEALAAYQAYLREHLPEYGLSEADLAGKSLPVLVRERVTPLAPQQRVAFAAEANQRTTLGMSTTEQARADAARIPDTALQGLNVGPKQTLTDALQAPANQPFLRQFIGGLPTTEQAALLDPQGRITQAGLERVASALFARTFDGPTGDRLLYAFRESLDPTMQNVQRALQDTLPALAPLKGGEFDLAPDLAAAVDVLHRLRHANTRVPDYLAQASMFDRELTPFQEQLLQFIDQNIRNRAQLRDTLAEYGRAAQAVPPPEQMGLFGEVARPAKGELLDRAASATTGQQPDLFAAAEGAAPAGTAADRGLGNPAAPVSAPAIPAAPAPAPSAVTPSVGSPVAWTFKPTGQDLQGTVVGTERGLLKVQTPDAGTYLVRPEDLRGPAPPVAPPAVATAKPGQVKSVAELAQNLRSPGGPPGVQIEPAYNARFQSEVPGFRVAVYRDEAGQPRGIALASDRITTPSGDVLPPVLEVAVDPALQRQGIATSLYDALQQNGYDVGAATGNGVYSEAGAAFANARAGRWAAPSEAPPPPVSAPVESAAAPMADVPLPKPLRGALPRYDRFQLDFASDVDRALYIVAQQAKRSKRDGDYLGFLQKAFPGTDEATLRQAGQEVRSTIKGLVQQAGDDESRLTIPQQFDRLLGGESRGAVPPASPGGAPTPAAPELAAEPGAPPPVPPGPPAEPGVGATPPDPLDATRQQLLVSIGPKANAATLDNLNKYLGPALDAVPKDKAFVAQLLEQHPEWADLPLSDMAKQYRQRLPGETPDALAARLKSPEYKQIVDLSKTYGKMDLLKAPEDEAAIQHAAQAYAAELSKNDPGWFKVVTNPSMPWNQFMKLWRQQALGAPSYLMQNITDGSLKGAIYVHNVGFVEGHNPWVNPSMYQEAWAKAGQHVDTESTVGRAALEARGLYAPAAFSRGTQTEVEIGARQGFERLPGLNDAINWLAPGALDTPIGRQMNKATQFADPGRWYSFNRTLNEAADESMRYAIFLDGYDRHLAQEAPGVIEAVQRAAPNLPPERLAELQQALLEGGKGVDPGTVRATLRAAGADENAVIDALRAFGEAKGRAIDAGTGFAKEVHFDYSSTTNLDEFLRSFLGFHFYATRNLPQFATILATHPGLARALAAYDEATTQANAAEGISDRAKSFENAVPIGGVGRLIAGTLFGGGQVFINPTRYMSAFQNVFQQPNTQRGETTLGKMLDFAKQMGVSLNPPLAAAANISGVFGAQQPQGLLRLEGLGTSAIQAATGQPVEPFWREWQRARPFGGQAPSDPKGAVNRRLQEMSIEQDGIPAMANPRFAQAMAQGPASPLWRQAASELGKQGVFERTLALGGLPTTVRRGGQETIERAQMGVPEANASGGDRPLSPLIPFDETLPGTPLYSSAMRSQALRQRAANGLPAAAGYLDPFPMGNLQQGHQASAYAQQRDSVLQAYRVATPAGKEALMQNPTNRAWILQDAAAHARLR